MTEESSFIAGDLQVKENNEKSEGNSSKWKDAFIIVLALACVGLALAFPFSRKFGKRNSNNQDSETVPMNGITEDGLTSYLGIPYALPPTGDRRLRPPVPHPMWSENANSDDFSATESKPGCLSGVEQLMQENFGVDFSDEKRSEDCLYMNIWAPDKKEKTEKLPVLVFIHGGSFLSGNASRYETVGDDVARKENIIVVSIQYRLGIYGFGYLGRDRSENIGHFEQGNFALQDVRLALKTIYANIHRFGGDKEQITVMGNSAGGLTVATLLSDEAPVYMRASGWPFYQKAVIQCPPMNLYMRTVEDIVAFNSKIINASGCSKLSCFQELTTDEVAQAVSSSTNPYLMDLTVNALFGTPFAPIADNITAFNPFRNRFQQDIPTMIGINADEPVTFLNMIFESRPIPDEYYMTAARLLFGKNLAPELLTFYPPIGDNRDQLLKIEQDAIFDCGSRRLLEDQAESFMYIFDAVSPKAYKHWSRDYQWGNCEEKACHCTDTGYFFGKIAFDTENQKQAAKRIRSTITNFIKSQDTGLKNSNGGAFQNLILTEPDSSVEPAKKKICDFWDRVFLLSENCAKGDKNSCFANWSKIIEAVQYLRSQKEQ